MKKIILLLCLVVGFFAACKKADLPPDTLRAISLGRDTLTMRVGQTIQLNVTTTPANYNRSLLNLSSSDTTVITVKNNGQIVAKKNGTAVITATNQAKTISVICLVSVADIPDPLKGVLFTDTLTMNLGDTQQLHYTTTPPNYNPDLLVWKSSDTTVVSVTGTGKVTAKSEGHSTITLTNKANTFSVSGIISVTDNDLKIGLLAFYPFNNSANDASGNGYNGQSNNLVSTTDRFGKANSAYYFDGQSSFIQVRDNAALRLSNTNFTINYWVNLDDYNRDSGSAVLTKANGPYQNGWNASISGYGSVGGEGGGPGYAFYNVSGGGDPFAVNNNTVIPTSKWTMITVQYNNSLKTITFYINGVAGKVVNNIPTPNPNTAVDLFIGKNSYNDPSGFTPAYFIKGKLDDIRIYGHILSAQQINRLFTRAY